jgi:AcrR family transcriptional regulator
VSEKKKRGRPPADAGTPSAKERLVAAARRLFARQGYDGTSVHDIAAEAGVADSALYGHFAGKAEIYQMLLHEAGPDVVIEALRNVDSHAGEDPPAFLRALCARVIEVWSSREARAFASIFTRDALDGRTESRGIFSAIADVQESLIPVIRVWQQRGMIRPSLDARQIVWEIFAPLVYIRFVYFQARSTRADVLRGKEAARRHIAHLIESLRAD